MTIYDLAEALKRYWKFIAVAVSVLAVLVIALTFQIRDGKVAFRAGLTYESTVQIAVVEPGTNSLRSLSAGTGRLVDAAVLYASLLQTDEAARWIGRENGYQLEELVDASTGRDNAVIAVRVKGPTQEQAIGAALSTVDWLNKKLQEPVETVDFPSPPTTLPLLVVDGPFVSFVNIQLDAGLADVTDELFLFVTIGEVSEVGVPLPQSAGNAVRSRATLEPLATVILTLRTASDDVLDTIRLAPDSLPKIVDALPELGIVMGDDSIVGSSVVDDTTGVAQTAWGFDASRILLEWLEGSTSIVPPSAVAVDVDLALLTPEPGFTSTGGRRGPIVGIAALMVGLVLVLVSVIVADTWRTERDARTVSQLKLTVSPDSSASNRESSHGRADEAATTEIQVQAKSSDR